jgi:tetratricopeptide (TPR) repeat protein
VSVLAAALLLLGAAEPAGAVAVLPPDGPAGAETAWVAEAIAYELPRSLSLLGVRSAQRLDRLRAQERLSLPSGRLTRATAIRVAESLGADRLVVGAYEVKTGAVSVSLRILDLERASLSSPLVAQGPVETLPALVAGLAFDIALSGPTRPSRAREVITALRASVPFEAWRTHAKALAAADAPGRASLLRRALQHEPEYDEARLDLARMQIEAREFPEALESLARIARNSSLSREARFTEGIALLGLGRYSEAAARYAELASADPSPAVLSNQAAARLRQKRDGEPASALLRQALERRPASLDLPVNLGFALLHEGAPEAAAFFLGAALKREPRDAPAHVLYSWALRQSGQDAEADAEWERAQPAGNGADPKAPDLQRRFERLEVTESGLVVDPDGKGDLELAASHLQKGELSLEAGQPAAAQPEFASAIALNPFDARARRLLARALRQKGEPAKAESELRLSLLCRDDASVRLELAELLASLGRPEEAREEARRVLLRDPGNAAAQKLAGDRPL